MTALDQAFIKAYMQHGVTAAAVSSPPARTVPLEEAFESSLPEAPDGSRPLSQDGILAALANPPARPAAATAAGYTARLPSSLPASPSAATGTREPVGTSRRVSPVHSLGPGRGTPVEAARRLDELQFGDFVYRLDAGIPAGTSAAAGLRPIPPPHTQAVPAEQVEPPLAFGEAAAAEAAATPAEPDETADGALEAMIKVDRFTWPRVCGRLREHAAEELTRLTDSLLAAKAEGRKVLGFAGCRRGEGTTSVLCSAARGLTERNVSVVLIDANLSAPQLAGQLGLRPQCGWEAISTRGMSVGDVVVQSAEDRLAVVPLCVPLGPAAEWADEPTGLAEAIATLAASYDLVLVDLGPLEHRLGTDATSAPQVPSGLDAVVLVHRAGITSQQRLDEVHQRLAAAGIVAIGVVENLVRE